MSYWITSTRPARDIYWMEEPFREDPVLLQDLRTWLEREGLPVLIADGEGEASSSLLRWARAGLVDVIQYDIFAHGFFALARDRRLRDLLDGGAPR